MPLRRCIEPDCRTLTPNTRCPDHQRARQSQRGYTTAYKAEHRRARTTLAPLVAAGTNCGRCGQPITDNVFDADRRPWGWEPAHPHCNRKAGAHHQP